MASITPSYDREGEHIGWQVAVRKKGYPAQYKTFRTKKEGEAWASVTESEIARGVWRDRSEAENTTLKECLDRYLAEVTPKKKSKGEGWYVQAWMKRPIAARFMASIRGKDLASEIRAMENEGKGANHVRLYRAVISNVFTVARRQWGMESLENPADFVSNPKLPQGRDRRLVDDEEERLLAECDSSRNASLRPVVIFAVETAMRAGEIVETWKQDPSGALDADGRHLQIKVSTGLLWKYVDLQRRTALLPKTKNGTPRTVPLSSRAVAVLEALPRNLDGRVFGTTYEGIHQAYVRACRRAAIDGLTFHDLRHEATSRLFEKGFNPMEVSAITGHKTLQMLKRYTHLRAEDLAKRMG
ncbi:integrase [Acidithiobacillus ferrivorans]|uniref:Integrase n=1 Tax=Acidithiobacillus ferrivorans TaxID=160808 RepID=A0A1B9BXS4_9PROT|nr:site-specific integrase [Acidithiobacillus ferrivorans]OCB02516.1 integrase [Acidithiobacillus ferrivorans]